MIAKAILVTAVTMVTMSMTNNEQQQPSRSLLAETLM